MFAQVIQGRTTQEAALTAAFDRWVRDLAPGSIGWLGSTGGVTDDGEFIAVARFESAEAAGLNASRPEQTAWWEETRGLFDGEVTFRDSEDVTVEFARDPDRAGFVQVMQGRVSDPQRARELMDSLPVDLTAEQRPDMIGSLAIGHEDGGWTQVLYFTSEAEAREGERKEMPFEVQSVMQEMDKLSLEGPVFFDLRRPVLRSPA
jgi:hypothetical protein